MNTKSNLYSEKLDQHFMSEGAKVTAEAWAEKPWPKFRMGEIVEYNGKVWTVDDWERSVYCPISMNPDWLTLRRIDPDSKVTFHCDCSPSEVRPITALTESK